MRSQVQVLAGPPSLTSTNNEARVAPRTPVDHHSLDLVFRSTFWALVAASGLCLFVVGLAVLAAALAVLFTPIRVGLNAVTSPT